MLMCLQTCEFHTSRIGKDFEYGSVVRTRNLEQSRVEEFFSRFEKMLPSLVELRAITVNQSKRTVDQIFQILTKTRQGVVRLSRSAELKNPLVGVIMNRLRSVTTVEFDKVDEAIERAIEDIEGLNTGDQIIRKERIVNPLRQLQALAEKTETKVLEAINEIMTLAEEEKVRNLDLEALIKPAYTSMDEEFYVLKDSLELADFVSNPQLQKLPENVMEFVASKFSASRDVTVFEHDMGVGQNLIHFKTKMKSKNEVWTYGTDEKVDVCRKAKENGVDFVAKKGIYLMTHNTFDIALNIMNNINFYRDTESNFKLPEDVKFNYTYNRQVPKSGGYVIFNIPYFKIDHYSVRISRDMTIEGMYRIDDAMSNVLFVCSFKRDPHFNDATIRKAMLNYSKLPHYTEMETYFINKGDLLQPKVFRPYFVDKEDVQQAFVGAVDTLDLVEEYYTPVDKIIELNAPLQEYREGHLPAVATIEIVNGLYDTNKMGNMIAPGTDFPNIYSTKIVQQDVTEEVEEMHKGEMVKVISQKKKNIIVANALLPNGEIVELLKTN